MDFLREESMLLDNKSFDLGDFEDMIIQQHESLNIEETRIDQ